VRAYPTEDFGKRLDSTMENIEGSEVIAEDNKATLADYKRDHVLDGLAEATLLKNLTRMKVMAEHLEGQAFEEMEKADVKDLVEWVHSEYDNESTIYTYKNVIRGFWKWLDGEDDGEAPETVAWVKLKNPSGGETLPQDLLSKEDMEDQIEAAHNPRARPSFTSSTRAALASGNSST